MKGAEIMDGAPRVSDGGSLDGRLTKQPVMVKDNNRLYFQVSNEVEG